MKFADTVLELPLVTWPQRAAKLKASPVSAAEAAPLLGALWSGGRLPGRLDDDALRRFAARLQFVRVASASRLIEQDEPGDFMLIVLDGTVSVDLAPGAGPSARLAEARAGDVLGEMALLDAGPRLSSCTTRSACTLAVLEMDALAALMKDDAPLAVVVLAALARKLSLRLRQASSRLSVLLSA
ncbi:MAG: cyclic nucleotide-binding domain-containing protein [Rubrivivax sp.]|nr:cyclic nucleotide-binding domain-containing protein [Rubrivivax sp.]